MRLTWMLVLALLLAPAAAPAQLTASEPVTVHALAVAQTPSGLEGVTATVSATAIADGEGRVFVQTRPLAQTDMQGSARLAVRVAADLLGLDGRDHDHLLAFRSDSPVIGGPSAGSVMALATATALWNLEHPDAPWTVDAGVAATGTINPDGTIGPVGGVPAKAEGAAQAGLHTVLYPIGQERFQVQEGTQVRQVSMDDHCAALGITCRPVATLAQLVEAATGRHLDRPSEPIPDTSVFQPQLGASVENQVAGLEAGLADASRRAEELDLEGRPGQVVQAAIDEATARLEDAQHDLGDGRLYLAATQSFRGKIHAGHAQALMDLYDGAPERAEVQAHVDACRGAVETLSVPDDAGDWTAVQAVGAAQDRVAAARDLLDQAQDRLDNAFTVQHWEESLFSASFCIERAATVGWWAGLADRFPAGAPVEDPDAVVQEAFARAQEMVAYAEAVLGASGEAGVRLQEATAHRDAGRWPAALLAAADAEALASVVLQTGTGAEVPDAVLEAAQQGAARAVGAARETGTEPIVSVSLIELSTDQEGAGALNSLWTARAVALLPTQGVAEPGAAPRFEHSGDAPGPEVAAAALLAGMLLGAGAVATLWMVVATRRP